MALPLRPVSPSIQAVAIDQEKWLAAPQWYLAVSAPLVVLDGTDVRDLSRADAAVLLIGLGRVTSRDVAAAARRLAHHDVPIVGAVTATDAVPSFVPLLEPHPPTSLGKLVATGLQPAVLISQLAVQQAHAYITDGETGEDEKQSIDCIVINAANADSYTLFALE